MKFIWNKYFLSWNCIWRWSRQNITHFVNQLIHPYLVPHMCISERGQHLFRKWLVAYSAPSHYLNQCWVIVNWALGKKLRWNFNQNTKLFIHENASENFVCKMTDILSRGEMSSGVNVMNNYHTYSNTIESGCSIIAVKCHVWTSAVAGNEDSGVICSLRNMLGPHWGQDKIAAISQTIFSNAFSWMEMCEFRLIEVCSQDSN